MIWALKMHPIDIILSKSNPYSLELHNWDTKKQKNKKLMNLWLFETISKGIKRWCSQVPKFVTEC